jgi:polyisoprenoid-binding protein YceI
MKRSIFGLPVLAIAVFLITSAFYKAPVKFTVDTNATTLGWLAKKVTGQHNGKVKVTSGELTLDGVKVKGGEFTIDLTTMTIEDLQGGSNEKLLGHLKSDDFFSVAKFPTAKFVLTSVTPKSGKTYTVKGKLTIKGITNDIEFPADITFSGKTMTATSKIKVDRTKYDIKYRSSNYFENLGDKAIYDEFELDLNLVATSK